MDVILPVDVEAKLSRLAAEQGRDRDSLVVEAVERMVDHDAWFVAEVEKGLADLDRGEVLSHEDLGKRIEERLTQRRTA
jgi:predicted transcriptional regulator